MDIKDVKASYYNVMHMVISKKSQPFQRHFDFRSVSGLLEDSWKQTPGKIMFDDSLSWCTIISLPYWRNRNGDYIVERVRVQPQLLQVLRDLPVCTGVGVRRDVVGIKEFYTLVSGERVELNGFVDLSVMTAAARFKLRSRNMTALGGLLWADLPPSLQVNGIGDIRFGYKCYSALAGIMLPDLFSEPDIGVSS